MLKKHLTRDFIVTKMNLNNYNDLFDPREHIQNIRNNLELMIQDTNNIYKILSITFYGPSQV